MGVDGTAAPQPLPLERLGVEIAAGVFLFHDGIKFLEDLNKLDAEDILVFPANATG
jgi:hypothetical protein